MLVEQNARTLTNLRRLERGTEPGRQIKVLQRRLEYLNQKLADCNHSQGAGSYLKAERKALAWAVGELVEKYPGKLPEEETQDE